MLDNSKVKKEVAQLLIAKSYCVIDNLLPIHFTQQILNELNAKDFAGSFLPARIGPSDNLQTNSSIRGDKIFWLDESLLSCNTNHLDSAHSTEIEIFKILNLIMSTLKEELLLSLTHFDAHYAIYPPGQGYKTHFDRKGQNNSREITFILYLNQNWEKIDGGELILYKENVKETNYENKDSISQIIEPFFNRMVFFNSQLFPHEVRSSIKQRKSLTGWFKSGSFEI